MNEIWTRLKGAALCIAVAFAYVIHRRWTEKMLDTAFHIRFDAQDELDRREREAAYGS